jgi:hypothetical protein
MTEIGTRHNGAVATGWTRKLGDPGQTNIEHRVSWACRLFWVVIIRHAATCGPRQPRVAALPSSVPIPKEGQFVRKKTLRNPEDG